MLSPSPKSEQTKIEGNKFTISSGLDSLDRCKEIDFGDSLGRCPYKSNLVHYVIEMLIQFL